jgi:hypothetical protein
VAAVAGHRQLPLQLAHLDGDCGATRPIFLSVVDDDAVIAGIVGGLRDAFAGQQPRSDAARWRRRPGASAIAAAATSSDAKRTQGAEAAAPRLHLDLDDLTNPEEADRLHHAAHRSASSAPSARETGVHVLGIDERQRNGERCRQREQHVAGEAAVRGVHADLPLDLEALAHDVREVVENLGQVAAVSRWMSTAVTKKRTSRIATRAAISFNASRSGRP